MKKTALIVDDSIYMRLLIKGVLTGEGYEIVGEAGNGATAIELALQHKPDLVTLDNILPDMLGIEIISILREEGLDPKVIMVSAVGQKAMLDRAKNLGALEYLVKPFSNEDLIALARKVA